MARVKQRGRRRDARRGPILTGFGVALILLAVAGFLAFIGTIPRAAATHHGPSDAIVVLTGGSLRLQTGLKLLEEQRGRKLFVSGVHRGVDVRELLRVARRSPDAVACCIALGHEAGDTASNAAETARWMTNEGFHDLLLVTAAYHMPRSLVEFRAAMPGIRIRSHPVLPAQVKLNAWWRWSGTAALLFGEYSKYVIARIRLLFDPGGPSAKRS